MIRMSSDIFIQIASYRDPQLGPTLRDAAARATDPRRLHFCIAWQHGPEETAEQQFGGLPEGVKLTILDIPHVESKGACWARHQIQQKYGGETYTMQLDSHHRFVDGWDDVCIDMLESLRDAGFAKPLLTAYLPSFDPERDPEARVAVPWYQWFDRFIPEGAVFTRPGDLVNWQERTSPPHARFYSAHFAFTLGAFALEVQHDPEFYFHGEEISITARAYTHGYDLFHPHRLIAWHEYTRRGRAKHWDDHDAWVGANVSCHDLNRQLFGMDEYADQPLKVAAVQQGPFGFGTVRSLEAYERYAGICFRRRAVTRAVLDNIEPTPDDNTAMTYAEFEASAIPRFRHCIDIGYDRVPLDDYEYWCVVFKDADGNDLYRGDAGPEEIAHMRNDPDHYCKVWREFVTDVRPATWVVWPRSKSRGWCPPIVGSLG